MMRRLPTPHLNAPCTPARNPRAGLVAVEVVIAAVIFTVAAFGAYRAVDKVTDAASTTFARGRSLGGARGALQCVAEDLRGAGHIQIDRSRNDHVLRFRKPLSATHRSVCWGARGTPGGWIEYRVRRTRRGGVLVRRTLDADRKRLAPATVVMRGLASIDGVASFRVANARNLYTIMIRLQRRARAAARAITLRTTVLTRNWRAAQILEASTPVAGGAVPGAPESEGTAVGGDTNALIAVFSGTVATVDPAALAAAVDKAQADLGRVDQDAFLRTFAMGLAKQAVTRTQQQIDDTTIPAADGVATLQQVVRFASWLANDTARDGEHEAAVAAEVVRANGLAAAGDFVRAIQAVSGAFALARGTSQ